MSLDLTVLTSLSFNRGLGEKRKIPMKSTSFTTKINSLQTIEELLEHSKLETSEA